MKRKMVTIRQIQSLEAIEGADRIELARVDGWKVVVQKGLHIVNNYVVYFEVDSFLPDTELFKNAAGRDGLKRSMLDNGDIVEGYRIRAIKLRGTVSQGLIVPLSEFENVFTSVDLKKAYEEQTDFTDLFGVTVFERPINLSSNADAKSNFPSFIPKTASIRVQNQLDSLWTAYCEDWPFQITYKLNGSSCTIYKKGNYLGLCSRNLELKFNLNEHASTSNFTRVAYKVHQTLLNYEHDYCIQGELVAPGIQANFENVLNPEFYAFNMYSMEEQEYHNPVYVENFIDNFYPDIKHIPIFEQCITLKELFGADIPDKLTLSDKIIDHAKGPSGLNGKYREGFVYKSLFNNFTFKAISEQYLTSSHNQQD